jgi:ankyrin repeat protein
LSSSLSLFYRKTITQALHIAIKEEHDDVALLLIDFGCDVTIGDSDGDTPLTSALDNQMYDVAALLVSKGADVSIRSKNLACQSLLHHYCSRGDVKALRIICAGMQGSGLEVMLEEGRGQLCFTPMHMAARGGRMKVVEMLMEMGATVDCKDKNGMTPADLAEKNRKGDLASLLRMASVE